MVAPITHICESSYALFHMLKRFSTIKLVRVDYSTT
jgi:hypothetical protein